MIKRLLPLTIAATVGVTGSALAFSDSPFFDLGDAILGGSLSELVGLYEEVIGYVEEIANADGQAILSYLIGEFQVSCAESEGEGYLPEACAQITPDGSTIADVLAENVGAMGLPVPSDYREAIDDELSDSDKLPTWGYYTNQTLAKPLVKNAGDRALAEFNAASLLSDQGQESIEEGLQDDASNSETIINHAQAANAATNTQDVLKRIAYINAHRAIYLQKMTKNSAQNRVDNQISNLNLANISRTEDQRLNMERVNQNLTTAEAISATLGITLF